MQVQLQRQALAQAGGRGFIGFAFIQRHHGQGGLPGRHRVQRRRDAAGGGGGQAFGHGQQQHATGGLLQQAGLLHRPAGLQRGAQVQAAQQPLVADGGGHAAHRRAGRQQLLQQRQPGIAGRAGRCPQPHAAQAGRVDGQQRGSQGGIGSRVASARRCPAVLRARRRTRRQRG